MRPTTLGSTSPAGAMPDAAPVPPSGLSLPKHFPLDFEPAQATRIAARIEAFDFRRLPPQEIATLGLEAETRLSTSLDGFLARVEQQDAPQLFKLVEALKDSVEQENLPALAASILDAKPTLFERLLGVFNRKALKKALDRAYEDAVRAANGKSRKLSAVIDEQENRLRAEMARVTEEIRHMDTVKEAYRASFLDFAIETAFLHGALAKARAELQALQTAHPDPHALADASDKYQALESRALAVEATMTGLPADHLVLRQLQNAGIQTLQEIAATINSRFTRIKMTLLTIHGARMVQDVQRISQEGANLDRNLDQVRKSLMKDVVGTAANAPGDNRLAAAQQLQGIVADTDELYRLSEAARQSNAQKFQQARELLAQSRAAMLDLGRKMHPTQP